MSSVRFYLIQKRVALQFSHPKSYFLFWASALLLLEHPRIIIMFGHAFLEVDVRNAVGGGGGATERTGAVALVSRSAATAKLAT